MELRTPKTERNRRQLHQSGTNMFNRCGQQFAFRYIQGIRRPPSAFMICGTATDKAVTYDLDSKILTGELTPKLDTLTDIAAQSVENDNRRDSIKLDPEDVLAGKSLKTVLGETKDKAVRLVKAHHKDVAPQILPWRTARKFTVNLDGFLAMRSRLLLEEAEIADLSPWRKKVMTLQAEALQDAADQGFDFVGEQDIVEKYKRKLVAPLYADPDAMNPVDVLNVRDTKTTTKAKTQDDIDNDDQLTAYATASLIVDQRLPNEVRLDVLIDRPVTQRRFIAVGESQLLVSHRTKDDVDVYLNRIANAIVGLQLGIFAPTNQTNWWCSTKFCGYADICPYFRKTTRPGDPTTELRGAGSSEDLLPILNKSVEEIAKRQASDEEEATKL